MTIVAHRNTKGTWHGSLIMSGFINALGITLFVALSDQVLHWFIVPLFFSGVLIGADAVDWLRGRLDTFDPAGVMGLLGLHFFVLAPLLHVTWDVWMKGVMQPPDWRDWLGAMGFLNFVGLVLYRFFARRDVQSSPVSAHQWVLRRKRFWFVLLGALLVTGVLQLSVYQAYGGFMGYISAFEDASFSGMGFVFMVSESFPILLMFGWAIYTHDRGRKPAWLTIFLVLAAFFLVRMMFGGLRGSRSNTIWALFWAVGIIHYWVRPVSKKVIAIGLAFLVAFMYLYGFYKGVGSEVLRIAEGRSVLAELEQRTGRNMEGMLLGDLGRADVQSFLLYRLMAPDRSYELAWGRTYFGAATLMIPSSLWSDRPPTKVREGTEIQYGPGTYSRSWWSSRIYGIAGEAMLNFGPAGVPVALLILGWLVLALRRFMKRLHPRDSRWLLVPLLIVLSFWALVSDSDNIVFVLVKNGIVPFLVIWLSSSVSAVKPSQEVRA